MKKHLSKAYYIVTAFMVAGFFHRPSVVGVVMAIVTALLATEIGINNIEKSITQGGEWSS